MSDNQNIDDHCLIKEVKYKQLIYNYRTLMRVLFSISHMDLFLENSETISKIIDKNIILENDLGL